jgi:hypothetical protein
LACVYGVRREREINKGRYIFRRERERERERRVVITSSEERDRERERERGQDDTGRLTSRKSIFD